MRVKVKNPEFELDKYQSTPLKLPPRVTGWRKSCNDVSDPASQETHFSPEPAPLAETPPTASPLKLFIR